MAYSTVDRANAALTAIGARRINALDEDVKEARVCAARFAAVRDALIRSHPWNFAMARARLAALADPPAWGWARAFALPVDALRVWRVAGLVDDQWIVEGRRLLSDAPAPLDIVYLGRVENPADWDSGFAEAFSARLAAEIAADIVDETATTERLWRLYREKLAEARRADAQEGSAEAPPTPSWIEARR